LGPAEFGPAEFGAYQLTTERLEADVCTLAAQISAATCRWLALVAELDRREAYKEWGCASMAQWLSWKCGQSMVTARQRVRVARALERLPAIRERFAAGALSYCKVRALTRVATPATEATLLELAEVATGEQLDRVVRTYERVSVDRDTAAAQLEARRLTVHHDEDGMVTIVARLTRDAAESVLAALDRAEEAVPDEPHDDPAESRRADALEHIAQSYLAGDAARPPTEVVVHVDAEQLTDPDRSPVLERLTCDTGLRVVVSDQGVTTASRRTRTVPVGLRRRLERRDRGCRFPSCSHRAHHHVHHLVHFGAGGPTDAQNCIILCSFHHRLVHEGGWRVDGDPAESRALRFINSRGRVVREGPDRTAPRTPRWQCDPRIDERTIATAERGRLDLDLAVTALLCRFARERR
jgi:hypothetical protein